MLYRGLIMFRFEVIDPENVVGVVYEMSAIRTHWPSDSHSSRSPFNGSDSSRLMVNCWSCRRLVAQCSCNIPKVEPLVMSWMAEFQHANRRNERVAVAVVRLPQFAIGPNDNARTFHAILFVTINLL
jgi:hypothetical protein